MIITKLKIENFHILQDLEITFNHKGDSPITYILGQNGSGKSTLLEAIIRILQDLDRPNHTKTEYFNYELSFIAGEVNYTLTCQGEKYSLKQKLNEKELYIYQNVTQQTLSQNFKGFRGITNLTESHTLRLMPKRVISLYSGHNNFLAKIYKPLHNHYKKLCEGRLQSIRDMVEYNETLIYDNEVDKKSFPELRYLYNEQINEVLFLTSIFWSNDSESIKNIINKHTSIEGVNILYVKLAVRPIKTKAAFLRAFDNFSIENTPAYQQAQDVFEREIFERNISKRDLSERNIFEREISKRDLSERDLFERDISKRERSKREAVEREAFKRYISKRDLFERDIFERDISKRDLSEKNIFDSFEFLTEKIFLSQLEYIEQKMIPYITCIYEGDGKFNLTINFNRSMLNADNGLTRIDIYNFLEKLQSIYNAKFEMLFNNDVKSERISDGERQFLRLIGLLSLYKNENAIILLDEPDTHMNPKWKYSINQIIKDCSNSNNNQIIIATHEPLMVNGLEHELIRKLEKDERGKIKALEFDQDTYGMGIDRMLTSEYYGLASSYDNKTAEEYKERKELYRAVINESATPTQKTRMVELTNKFGTLPVMNNTIDILYNDFILAYKKSEYYGKKQYKSSEEIQARQEEIKRIIDNLFEDSGE